MSYRYNIIDITVGVGMCAILFGALLFFVAANGTYQAALPPPLSSEQSRDLEAGMMWLQPALGQAIVEQALFERRADRTIALAASNWNRATLAHDEFRSRPGGPFGAVMRYAATVPANHKARVQEIMGRAIVTVTLRGVRNGLVSADLTHSAFNLEMIRTIEARGQFLHHQFASTWQAALGRHIVEAAQDSQLRAEAIQERLGTAVIQLAQAQMESEQVRAMQQEKLGGFVLAATRAQALTARPASTAAVTSIPAATAVAVTEPASWPEIPLGYLIVAAGMLAMVFFVGLSVAARSREEKELARRRHDASRWVYRMAS